MYKKQQCDGVGQGWTTCKEPVEFWLVILVLRSCGTLIQLGLIRHSREIRVRPDIIQVGYYNILLHQEFAKLEHYN